MCIVKLTSMFLRSKTLCEIKKKPVFRLNRMSTSGKKNFIFFSFVKRFTLVIWLINCIVGHKNHSCKTIILFSLSAYQFSCCSVLTHIRILVERNHYRIKESNKISFRRNRKKRQTKTRVPERECEDKKQHNTKKIYKIKWNKDK